MEGPMAGFGWARIRSRRQVRRTLGSAAAWGVGVTPAARLVGVGRAPAGGAVSPCRPLRTRPA
jgi:hypothetical protein